MTQHVPMTLVEALGFKGDDWLVASEAMKKRERAGNLLQEVNQLIAEAEALENVVRAYAARPQPAAKRKDAR